MIIMLSSALNLESFAEISVLFLVSMGTSWHVDLMFMVAAIVVVYLEEKDYVMYLPALNLANFAKL